ncbi:MAG: hypothetical protein HDS80_03160 [Bacteroidales bacterium]|nr:hypothetical protein [Bacteroidales bacterium]
MPLLAAEIWGDISGATSSRGRTASTIRLLIDIQYISYGYEFVVSPIFNSAGNKFHFGKRYIQ